QISDQDRQSVSSIFRRAIFDLDVLACDEACFPQALAERGRQMRGISERGTADESDHRHRRLLRVCRERPCRRTAEQRDELASSWVEHGLLPGTRYAAYRRLRMPRKHPQVLGADLKSSESTPLAAARRPGARAGGLGAGWRAPKPLPAHSPRS